MSVIVNLPPATGSGRDHTITNDTGDIVAVTADTTGVADTINGVATYNMSDGESITVVAYVADKWAII